MRKDEYKVINIFNYYVRIVNSDPQTRNFLYQGEIFNKGLVNNEA